MEFTDPETIQARARAVRDMFSPQQATLTNSETRVAVVSYVPGEPAVFDAVRGTVAWPDLDGELRTISLPAGVTSEAVAALLWGLAGVVDWK